jgi:hypothetical protein
MPLSKSQQHFADITAHIPEVKKAISSKEEYKFKKILNTIGIENKDWFHQKPFIAEEEGLVAVCDFCLPGANLIIELDDKKHRHKNSIERDIKRDKVFNFNDYYVLRIPAPIPEDKLSYWKVYVEELYNLCLKEKENNKKKKTKKLFSNEEFKKEFYRQLEKYNDEY